MECVALCILFISSTHLCGSPSLKQSLSASSRRWITSVDITQRLSRALFSKKTQTITDLITPELYHSCCRVFTLSDTAETTAPIRTEEILISTFPTCCLSQTTKITASNKALEPYQEADALRHPVAKQTATSNVSPRLSAFSGSRRVYLLLPAKRRFHSDQREQEKPFQTEPVLFRLVNRTDLNTKTHRFPPGLCSSFTSQQGCLE